MGSWLTHKWTTRVHRFVCPSVNCIYRAIIIKCSAETVLLFYKHGHDGKYSKSILASSLLNDKDCILASSLKYNRKLKLSRVHLFTIRFVLMIFYKHTSSALECHFSLELVKRSSFAPHLQLCLFRVSNKSTVRVYCKLNDERQTFD